MKKDKLKKLAIVPIIAILLIAAVATATYEPPSVTDHPEISGFSLDAGEWGLFIPYTRSAPTSPPPQPTSSAPTEIPFDVTRWWEFPESLWPKYVNGYRVAYLKVIAADGVNLRYAYKTSRVGEYNEIRVFRISQPKGLRPDADPLSLVARRVKAKYGNIIMVWANGNIYQGIPFKAYARPFMGDGGNHSFLIMYENNIDGIYMGAHPQRPLFIPYYLSGAVMVEPYYPDGNGDWLPNDQYLYVPDRMVGPSQGP